MVRTLIGISRHIGLHLNLDGPTSGNSPWMCLNVLNHRILNDKIVVELLGDRVGLAQGYATVWETGESLIRLEMALSWERAVLR